MHAFPAKGFTLIELLIVVAVIAILATIAYPSYQQYVQHARRSDAMGALAGLAGAMQRHYTEQTPFTYAGAAASGPPGPPAIYPAEAPLDGGAKYYDLTIQSASASAYELRAAPKGSQADDKCGKLTLKSSGEQGVLDAESSWRECWR